MFTVAIDSKLRGFDLVALTVDDLIRDERPFVIGLVAKDFMENGTGLVYIGARNQQIDVTPSQPKKSPMMVT